MSKRATILLHIAVWIVLFLSPLTFFRRSEDISLMQMAMVSLAPLATILVFYVNYLWLTPRYFISGEKRWYWVINMVLVAALGIGTHLWMSHVHSLFAFSDNRPEPDMFETVGFILRDIFQLTIAAAIATAIQLAMRWQHSEAARIEAEAARAEAELKNLRWQVNPHFLLNTLNNIYALTAIDTNRAQQAIQELSRLMRHVLYDNQQPSVPLGDELEFIHNYIELMKIRLPQTVDVQYRIPTAIPNRPIAPLVLISLVENAFKHGVSPTLPSYIHVTIEVDDDTTVCDIRNSNYPKTETDRSGHGIGLQQVRHRLDLAYPGRYTWQYGPTDNGNEYHSHIEIKQS